MFSSQSIFGIIWVEKKKRKNKGKIPGRAGIFARTGKKPGPGRARKTRAETRRDQAGLKKRAAKSGADP